MQGVRSRSASAPRMGTARASRRARRPPQRRKREEGASAAARGGGGDQGPNTSSSSNSAPRPFVISGPAPFRMPRWPLPPLDEEDAARGSTPSITPAGAELARSRLRMVFDGAVADAVELGVPRSALPAPQEGASADELAAALAHVEDVVASFMSANI